MDSHADPALQARPPSPSTAAWPAPSCDSSRPSPRSAACRSPSMATSRRAHRPMGTTIAGLRGLGVTVDDDGRGALPFTVRRHRIGRRGPPGDRRLRQQPVRLGPPAGGSPLRAGPGPGARRRPAPLAAAHRHDGRRAAPARRAGRRRRGPVVGAHLAPSTAWTSASSQICPTPARSSPPRWSPPDAPGSSTGRRPPTSPVTTGPRSPRRSAERCSATGTTWCSPARPPCAASTSTCTTSAS